MKFPRSTAQSPRPPRESLAHVLLKYAKADRRCFPSHNRTTAFCKHLLAQPSCTELPDVDAPLLSTPLNGAKSPDASHRLRHPPPPTTDPPDSPSLPRATEPDEAELPHNGGGTSKSLPESTRRQPTSAEPSRHPPPTNATDHSTGTLSLPLSPVSHHSSPPSSETTPNGCGPAELRSETNVSILLEPLPPESLSTSETQPPTSVGSGAV